MKHFFLCLLMLTASLGFTQINLPVDFESAITTSDFTDFDGGVATVIANPQSSGINTSATVAQIVRNGGAVWAGSKITFSNTFDFRSLGAISMKVYTDAPAGTQVKLKLEGGLGEFISDAVTKTSGAWETLVWDFSTAPQDKSDLVFMFDFGFLGDGSVTSTFLFDDIEQIAARPPVDLDIDFEQSSTITSDFTNFDGGTATVIPNPQASGRNTSSTVGQIVRNGGQVWSGSKLILAQNLDFSALGYISVDVFTTKPIGTMMQIKIEGSATPVELAIPTTTTNQWETMLFDFRGTSNKFNTVVFMFDIGNLGDGSPSSTFLFDNVKQTDGTSTSLLDQMESKLSVYPNPSKDVWHITSQQEVITALSLYNALGVEIASYKPEFTSLSIDASFLAAGTYMAIVSTQKGKAVLRLVK